LNTLKIYINSIYASIVVCYVDRGMNSIYRNCKFNSNLFFIFPFKLNEVLLIKRFLFILTHQKMNLKVIFYYFLWKMNNWISIALEFWEMNKKISIYSVFSDLPKDSLNMDSMNNFWNQLDFANQYKLICHY